VAILSPVNPVPRTDAPTLRAALAAARSRVGAALAGGAGGMAVCHAMSDALDRVVVDACGQLPEGVAVVATGGWGRRETCPFSDIDILFLTEPGPGDQVRAFAERVLYPLWDTGLEVGHAVRGLAETVELADRDLATATALLDARHVVGDAALAARLVRDVEHVLTRRGDANAFVRKLVDEKQGRHARFGETLFLLEPNLKHGQGALRDLATGLWAARARFRVRDFAELVPLGQATARQVATLSDARELLLRVRAELHLRAGRRLDQLTFEMQEAIAPGMFPEARIREGEIRPAVAPAVEELMRRYYLHAKGVVRETDRLLERAIVPPHRPPRIAKLDASFVAFNGQVSVADAQIFRDRPAEMLRLFRVALEHDLPVYGHTKEIIAERVAVDGSRLPDDPDAQRWLREALVDPRDRHQPALLEEMHELGLLTAVMPEFAPCTGRVQHDLYHVYTVDQHQLYAVALQKRIARGELADSAPVVTAALAEIRDPRAVALATLLHDVGKPLGKGHSEKGARLAGPIARRLGYGAEEVARVEFLVRHHLIMSHLSQRRDLDDVRMIEKFVRLVKDDTVLRELYVLTWCDTAMTAPGNLTEWKAALLTELYQRTRAFLHRGPDLASAERSSLVKRRRRRVAELLPDVPGDEVEAFLSVLPDRYMTALLPRAIAQHVRLARELGDRPAAVSVRSRRAKGYTELLVVAPDAPGLLARIAGVLLANRIDILGAQIHSSSPAGGLALDVFQVRDRIGQPIPAKDPRWARVEADVQAVLAGKGTVEELIAGRREKTGLKGRVTPEVPTEVEIDNEISDDYTVIDVFTEDRLGVLYAITHTLTELGLDISLSKVATEATRVADIFYVTKITDAARLAEIAEALRRGLAEI
jgi:[protein-PII] uridylyltransferase